MNEYINYTFSPRKIVTLVLSLQIALVGLIILDYMGFSIPLIRQVIGFVYLGFLPGFLFLKILKIKKNLIETISYSAGLSIALLMLIGLMVNYFCPLIGNNKPISLIPLIFIFSFFNMSLLSLYYKRNTDNCIKLQFKNFYLKNRNVTFLLILLPLLSIIGTYYFNLNGSNIFLLILITLIAAIMIIFAFKKNSPEIYPVAVFMIAVSLLLHRSLITNYITGWDVQLEYYYASLVIKNSFYNINLQGTLNSLLSLTIFNPIFSIILNINEIWVFKITYPIFFSIVPLFLYNMYNKSMCKKNEKIVFFSVFLFISFYAFYTEMLGLARQELAMLFIVLIAGIILDEKNSKLSLVSVIFVIGLIFSHYTSAYLFLFILFIFILPHLFKKDVPVGFTFLCLFVVLSYAWYVYTSNSSSFEGVLNFISHIYNSINSEFFSSSSRDPGVGYITGQLPELSMQRLSFAFFQYLVQLFIGIGLIVTICSTKVLNFKKLGFLMDKNFELNTSFFLLSIGCFCLLIFIIIVPVVSTINISRIFLMSLMFLAPLGVIGGIFICKSSIMLLNKVTQLFNNISINSSLKLVVIFVLVPYFLLNIGFVYYVSNDPPSSISLDKNMDYAKYSTIEINGVKWLASNRNNGSFIYGDVYGILPFIGYIRDGSLSTITNKIWWKKGVNYYIYLRHNNLKEDELLISQKNLAGKSSNVYVNLTSLNFPVSNKIYDGGSSAVLNINSA